MSGFADYLRRLIAAEGPQAVERVMAEALGHPNHGYYISKDPLGAAGDFITAPEISQMFGELIGLWCAVVHEQMGTPSQVHLIELGPGRGTLLADALRATQGQTKFRAALALHMVEISPALQAVQRATLGAEPASWHERLDEVPEGPAIIVANEFFDALPVRQIVATRDGWRERVINWDAAASRFTFTQANGVAEDLPDWLPPAKHAPAGGIAEVAPARDAVARAIGARLARDGGAALVIDYGHSTSAPRDTLQAVRAHRKVSVLETLGEADLTAHVDFAALARAAEAEGARSFGPIGQGRFLLALGIEARAARLAAKANPAQAAALDVALARLTAPNAMGMLFKAVALTGPNALPPPGFERAAAQANPEWVAEVSLG